jgi:hypothetical protein
MMRSRPPRASATPATILLAALALNLGISAAANQIPANRISRNPHFGDDHPGVRRETIG